MINWALFRREMRSSVKLLLLFGAIMTLYVFCIIRLYDPQTMQMLDGFTQAMPEIMAAVGMTPGAENLLGFMVSYLYGFILLIFPMVFSILRAISLLSRYTEQGSMVYLMAAPVKRRTIAWTQAVVLLSGIFVLIIYTTLLELVVAQSLFPGELMVSELLLLNTGLLFLHFSISSICFFASCTFSETKYSALLGAGLPTLMYVFKMIVNVDQAAEIIKFFSLFTLFDPNGLIAGEADALLKIAILFVETCVVYAVGITVFCKKDLHI